MPNPFVDLLDILISRFEESVDHRYLEATLPLELRATGRLPGRIGKVSELLNALSLEIVRAGHGGYELRRCWAVRQWSTATAGPTPLALAGVA